MDFTAILDFFGARGAPHKPETGGIPYAVIPESYALHSLEKQLPVPARDRAKVAAQDTASFVAYFNDFANEDSRIFANLDAVNVVGFIDYHGKVPAFGEHRVTYTAPLSPEWKTWTGVNGRKMTQVEFARFVEDNLPDIVDPAGASVLEISRKLEAKKKVEFKSSVRLGDGSHELHFSEETQKGTMTVPDSFALGIPVFLNGERYKIEARLRYRIEDGKLQFWTDLLRPEETKRDAFEQVVKAISEGTKRFVYSGAADLSF